MARFGDLDTQYFDDAGDPLAYGRVYFYESGTTTPKTTYADVNNSIPNPNPVLLTAAGRQPNIFFDGVARAILTNSSDVQIAVRDPVGETATDFGDQWVATKIYGATDVVLGSDGIYYRSLINGNQNNNPVTSSGYWTLLYSVEWNSGITYDIGSVVTYENQQYQSLQSSNIGNNPASATAYWVGLSFAWLASATYSEGMNAVGTDGVLYTSLQNSNTGNDPATSPAYWVGTSAAAAASAVAAAASAAAALVSENAAELAETNAETAQAAAEAAQAAAETAETNSAASAASSATSASESAASAAAALVSQNAAATSESNSASSATASASSASAALASETAAAASESAAATSESNAAASASSSASSASASASSASDSATSASASASSATDSANSAASSAGSATAAAGSATSAAGSATAAATSATAAQTAETGVEAAVEEFEGLYLGAKSTPPTTDNQGNPLQTGTLYFNTVSSTMFVWGGSSWAAAGSAVNGTAERQEYVATSGQTNFSATYDVGFVDVYLNGVKLIPTTDFTATDGATIILATGAVAGDNVSIIAYGAFELADVYTKLQSDARYTQKANNLSDLDSAATALTNLGLTATAAELNTLDGITATTTELNYVDGVTSNIQTQIDNIDALPSQTGNAGSYLTTDGTTASWAEVSASPTLEAVASGTLANGDTVVVNSDGTVSAVTQTSTTYDPAEVGTESVFNTGTTSYLKAAYDTAQNKILIIYTDDSNSYYGTAVVGEVSGNSITFGAETVWVSTAVFYNDVVYDVASGKMVIVYSLDDGSNHGKAIVATISGLTVTFGSAVSWSGTNIIYRKCVCYNSTEEKVVIFYQNASASSFGYGVVGTVSGTSISFGGTSVFNSGTTTNLSCCYDENANKCLVSYRDGGNSQYGTSVVGTISGTSISFGSEVVFNSGDTEFTSLAYDSFAQKVIVSYRDAAGSNYGKAKVGTISGTSISFGSAANFELASVYDVASVYDPIANKTVISYTDQGNLNRGTFAIGTVSGTSISFNTPVVFKTDGTFWNCLCYDTENTAAITSYRGTSNYGNSVTIQNISFNTNITSENYIGISDGAYADAATAKVQIVGSVDDAQSGLTAGQSYYVQQDGTLAVTPDNPSVFAGTAVSATKLIVKG